MKERPILFSAPMVRAIIAGRKTQTRRVMSPQPYSVWGYGVPLPHVDKQRRFGVHAAFNVSELRVDRWLPCPYGTPGDRLWVKETHAFFSIDAFKYLYGPLASLGLRAYGGAPLTPGCHLRWQSGDAIVDYAAHPTSPEELRSSPGFSTWRSNTPDRWRPSIFMPRWASRITLEVTGVRAERLHAITELDALAEGVEGKSVESVLDGQRGTYVVGSARDEFADLWRDINGAESWDANPWVWVVEFAERSA